MPLPHPAQFLAKLVAGCALSLGVSGCITISPNSASNPLKSLTQPKVQRASYEEKVPDAPGNPKNPARLKVAYGRLMEESGQLAEARKSYQSALESQPKELEAIMGLARLDQLAGQPDQAEMGFKKAVKIAPNSAPALYSLGQFYASQDRWQEATETLTKAMLAEPDDSQARYALAISLVHVGNVDAALPHFIRTIGDAEAHYNVGLILQEHGKLDDAERHFALAVTKKPDLVAAQNWLVHVREQRQSPVSAPEQSLPEQQSSIVIPAGHSASTSASLPGTQAPAPAAVLTAPKRAPHFERKLSAQQDEQIRNQRTLFGS